MQLLTLKFRPLVLFLCGLWIGGTGASHAGETPPKPDVVVGGLDNGLRYVLATSGKKNGQIEIKLRIGGGSRQESTGQAQAAHLLEHVKASYTPVPGGGRAFLPDVLASFGYSRSASTSFDFTQYQFNGPSARMRDALPSLYEILADDDFSSAELDFHRDIIAMENAQRDETTSEVSNAIGYFAPQMSLAQGYEWLKHIRFEDVGKFYHEYYRPDHALIYAYGDFDKAELKTLIRAQFGHLPRRADAPPHPILSRPSPPFVSASHPDIKFVKTWLQLGTPYPALSTVRDVKDRAMHWILANVIGRHFQGADSVMAAPYGRIEVAPHNAFRDPDNLGIDISFYALPDRFDEAVESMFGELAWLSTNLSEADVQAAKGFFRDTNQYRTERRSDGTIPAYLFGEYVEGAWRGDLGSRYATVPPPSAIESIGVSEIRSALRRLISSAGFQTVIVYPERERGSFSSASRFAVAVETGRANPVSRILVSAKRGQGTLSRLPAVAPLPRIFLERDDDGSRLRLPEIGVAILLSPPSPRSVDKIDIDVVRSYFQAAVAPSLVSKVRAAVELASASKTVRPGTVQLGDARCEAGVPLSSVFLTLQDEARIEISADANKIDEALDELFRRLTPPKPNLEARQQIRQKLLFSSHDSLRWPANVLNDVITYFDQTGLIIGSDAILDPDGKLPTDAEINTIWTSIFGQPSKLVISISSPLSDQDILRAVQRSFRRWTVQTANISQVISRFRRGTVRYNHNVGIASDVAVRWPSQPIPRAPDHASVRTLSNIFEKRIFQRLREVERGTYAPRAGITYNAFSKRLIAWVRFNSMDKDVEQLTRAAWDELAQIQSGGVSDQEIERAEKLYRDGNLTAASVESVRLGKVRESIGALLRDLRRGNMARFILAPRSK